MALLFAVATTVLAIVAVANYSYPTLDDVDGTCKLSKLVKLPCAVARSQLASFSIMIIAAVVAFVCALVQLVALIKARYVSGRYTLWIVLAVFLLLCTLVGCFVTPITLWANSESYPKTSTQKSLFAIDVISAVLSIFVLILVIIQKRYHGPVYQLLG